MEIKKAMEFGSFQENDVHTEFQNKRSVNANNIAVVSRIGVRLKSKRRSLILPNKDPQTIFQMLLSVT